MKVRFSPLFPCTHAYSLGVYVCPCRTGFMILLSVLIASAEVMWALGCLVKTVLLHSWAWSRNLARGSPTHSHLMHAGYSHVRVGNVTGRLLSLCLLIKCHCAWRAETEGKRGVAGAVAAPTFVFCLWSGNWLLILFISGMSLSGCFKTPLIRRLGETFLGADITLSWGVYMSQTGAVTITHQDCTPVHVKCMKTHT